MGSVGTMKAGQFDANLGKVVINTVPIPEPGPTQFRIKLISASLCHSDLMTEYRPKERPITMGHEGVGVIDKMHADVADKGFKEGDKVGSLYFIDCCFECEGCQVFNMHCEKGTAKIQGIQTDGFFAEYALVEWRNCIKLPDTLDIKRAAPLFCAGVTAFHAVDSCDLKPGQWFGVVGSGGLGQLATQYAKAMGAKVVAIDINDGPLEAIKEQGADAAFNSRTNANYAEEIKKLTNGGVHAAAVFSAAGAAYKGTWPILRLNGLMMIVGIPPKDIELSCMAMTIGLYRVKAESTSIPQRMPKAIEFTAKHGIQPVVAFKKLEDLQDMIDAMHDGRAKTRQAVLFE